MSELHGLQLNLGCGYDRRPGFIGVDLFDGPQVDQIVNLDHGIHWPWEGRSVRWILARHIFEHVNDPVYFMAECWRVLEPGGRLDLVTPHWKSRDAYTDPTHKRFPTEHTFDYWVPGRMLRNHHGMAYADVAFQYGSEPSIIGGELHVNMIKIVV